MPRQTITRTVRLSPEVDRELQQLAKQERVSVNYLVASSLKRLTEWDILAEKFGFVAVPGFLHARMYSYFTVSRLSFLKRKSMKSLPKFFAAHSPSSLACSTVK